MPLPSCYYLKQTSRSVIRRYRFVCFSLRNSLLVPNAFLTVEYYLVEGPTGVAHIRVEGPTRDTGQNHQTGWRGTYSKRFDMGQRHRQPDM